LDLLDLKESVFKVSMPREDLSVMIGGVKMTASDGTYFVGRVQREGKDEMVMGDVVLTQDQITPCISVTSAASTE
jgi:uncharacterized protein DUF1259